MMMISISRQDGTRSTGKASSAVQTRFRKIMMTIMRMSVIMSTYHVRLFHVFLLLAQFEQFWAPVGVGVDVVVGVDVACEYAIADMGLVLY